MNYLILAALTLVTGVVFTGLGGVIGATVKRDLNKIFTLVFAFIGGLMVAVVCVDLVREPVALIESGTMPPATPVVAFVAITVGYLAVYFLNHFIDKRLKSKATITEDSVPSTVDSTDTISFSNLNPTKKRKTPSLFVSGLFMMAAIALHNMFEGMVIGASYAPENLSKTLFTGTAFLVAMVMGLHNVTEGISLSAPLIKGGENKTKTILLTALSGLPTVFGALIGYALGCVSNMMLIISRGLAVGAIMHVVFGELMSEAVLFWRRKLPNLLLFGGIIVGITIVTFIIT